MLRRIVGSLAAALVLGLYGCGGADEPSSVPAPAPAAASTQVAGDAPPELRVGLVVGISDGPSLDLVAREGLRRAENELGIEGDVLTSRTSEGYRRNLATLARQGHDLVIAVGRHRAGAMAAVAARFRGTRFAIVDAGQSDLPGSAPNVRGLLFREEEAGYLAGYLAGLVTKYESGSRAVIGSVGGRKTASVDRYIAGYRAGARAANPNIMVSSRRRVRRRCRRASPSTTLNAQPPLSSRWPAVNAVLARSRPRASRTLGA